MAAPEQQPTVVLPPLSAEGVGSYPTDVTRGSGVYDWEQSDPALATPNTADAAPTQQIDVAPRLEIVPDSPTVTTSPEQHSVKIDVLPDETPAAPESVPVRLASVQDEPESPITVSTPTPPDASRYKSQNVIARGAREAIRVLPELPAVERRANQSGDTQVLETTAETEWPMSEGAREIEANMSDKRRIERLEQILRSEGRDPDTEIEKLESGGIDSSERQSLAEIKADASAAESEQDNPGSESESESKNKSKEKDSGKTNHSVEITRDNYDNYVNGTKWTEMMQPLSWEAWVKWQEGLKAEQAEQDPRDKEISELKDQIKKLEENQQRLLEQIQSLTEQLGGGPPEGGGPEGEEPQPTPQEKLASAEGEMAVARDALVAITIRRRGRTGDGMLAHRKEDKQAYAEAMEAYKASVIEYLRSKGDVMESDNPEISEEEIAKQLMLDRYGEQIEFKQREVSMNEELYKAIVEGGGIKAKYAKVLRWWADRSMVAKVIIGATVGGVAFLASGPLGLGLAAVAGGSAVKFSLGVLNRSASARNRSKQSAEREIKSLKKEMEKKTSKLKLAEGANGDGRGEHIENMATGIEKDLNKDVVRAQRRNRLGAAMMLVGAGAAAYGIASLLDKVPFGFNFGGGGGGGGGNGVDMSNFNPDSFKGPNGNAAVWHAFDVIKRNNISVRGLNPDAVRAINADLASQHFHIASGMGANGQQNIIDWRAGQLPNAGASNLQGLEKVGGSSVGSWKQFMDIARNHGVTFTQESK